jgi:hypothetical protein
MLQASIPNVSSIFQTYVVSVFIWILYMFHTYIASVLSRCCVCFTMVLSVFASVLDVCFKCFVCLQTYVASVAYECFKSRSGVASLSSPFSALPRCLLLLPVPAGHSNQRRKRALQPPPLLDASDVRGGAVPRVRPAKRSIGVGVHPDVWRLATPYKF